MGLTNYIYFTIFFDYLERPMSMSFTRSIDLLLPASLSEVAGFAEFHVSDYESEGGESPLTYMAELLAGHLPIGGAAVRGVRALGFREGAVSPVVYTSSRVIAGGRSTADAAQLPTFVAASYSAPTFTYRRSGPRFSLPVVDEAFSTGNTLNATFNASVLGRDFPGPAVGFLQALNDDAPWGIAIGLQSRKTVVKRVPNTAPEGSGSGDRLPTFLVDPVDAVIAGNYDYSNQVRTQNTRKVT